MVELERAGAPVDLSRHVENALHAISAAGTLRALCDGTAELFKDLTGYDRVMVYRFDEEGHGEVFSERREPGLEPYLGNRYPATDIPQIARRLYERNRVRVLVDVGYEPVPLTPRLSPLTGSDLDMSLCFLRSMSPIHIQYLKNMGVGATLVASLVVGGKLWGLVACHHYAPRYAALPDAGRVRAAGGGGGDADRRARELRPGPGRALRATPRAAHDRGDLARRRLADGAVRQLAPLLQPLNAGGAALLLDGQVLTAGEVPGTAELRRIGAWLDSRPRAPVTATASLGGEEPALRAVAGVASGLLAAPVSSLPGEYLVWFRPERVRTVTWGGDPFKAVVIGNDPADLSPRRSFAKWHQLVEGTCEPWTTADLAAGRLIGETVADVVLQFRAVRMLIAQDQLEQVSRQVRVSGQPVLVADARGRVLLANGAFDRLWGAATPRTLDELPPRFAGPEEARRGLRDLVEHGRAWRGEVRLTGGAGDRPLLVRADPVFSSPGRALGLVLLLTDITEQRAAEAARRRFQEGVIERHRRSACGRFRRRPEHTACWHVLAKLREQRLERGEEAEALPRREIVAEHDLLQLGVAQRVEVEVSGQVAPQPSVRVLDRALLPGGVGVAEPGRHGAGAGEQAVPGEGGVVVEA